MFITWSLQAHDAEIACRSQRSYLRTKCWDILVQTYKSEANKIPSERPGMELSMHSWNCLELFLALDLSALEASRASWTEIMNHPQKWLAEIPKSDTLHHGWRHQNCCVITSPYSFYEFLLNGAQEVWWLGSVEFAIGWHKISAMGSFADLIIVLLHLPEKSRPRTCFSSYLQNILLIWWRRRKEVSRKKKLLIGRSWIWDSVLIQPHPPPESQSCVLTDSVSSYFLLW